MGKVISGHTWNHPKISILRDGSSHASLPGQFLPGRFLTSSPFHQGQLSPGALELLALRDSHYSNLATRANFHLVPLGYFPLGDTQHCVTRRPSKFMPKFRQSKIVNAKWMKKTNVISRVGRISVFSFGKGELEFKTWESTCGSWINTFCFYGPIFSLSTGLWRFV